MRSIILAASSLALLSVSACGADTADIDDLGAPAAGGGMANVPSGGSGAVPDTTTPGEGPVGGPADVPVPGAVGGSGPGVAGGSGPGPNTSEGGSGPDTGQGGTSAGGNGGTTTTPPMTDGGRPGVGGMTGMGGAGPAEPGPYDPRQGDFKVLVYSRTAGFPHTDAINEGRRMLRAIGAKQGFEVVIDEDNAYFNAQALADFELIFMLNPTGNAMEGKHEQAMDAWMKDGGAMVGVHSMTDFEKDWPGYKEWTMQYYDGHSRGNTDGLIQIEPSQKNHPAMVGLPDPWNRKEEWYKFNSYQQWTQADQFPGLIIFGRTSSAIPNNGPPGGQPMIFGREWDSYRVFYTALGHAGAVYTDAAFIKHITGGIMWAVRRDHLIKP